jgi:thioredoxin 1
MVSFFTLNSYSKYSLFIFATYLRIRKKLNIMALEFTDANFQALVLSSDKPVIVDFWAVWCGPCRMVGPIVQEIGEEFSDSVVVGKLDVDHNPETARKYGIRNIPTILFFKGGEVVDKQVGAVPKQVLVEKLEKLM